MQHDLLAHRALLSLPPERAPQRFRPPRWLVRLERTARPRGGVNRDDFEEWINDHLSEAIEELRDIECSPKKWIVMLSDSFLAIAKREQEESEDEPDNDDIDDDIVLAGADEDEA
jgi:hypothetical protein